MQFSGMTLKETESIEKCYGIFVQIKVENLLQSNLSNTDTEGTEQNVRIRAGCPFYRGHQDDIT